MVAQGDVLRATGLGRGDPLSPQVLHVGDTGPDDERRATAGGARNDAHRLALALHEGVDGWVRAEVGRVERAGEQRLHRSRAGAEGLGGQRRAAEGLGEDACCCAVHGGGVGEQREVAEPEFGSRRAAGGGNRENGSASGVGRGAADGEDEERKNDRGRTGRAAHGACFSWRRRDGDRGASETRQGQQVSS